MIDGRTVAALRAEHGWTIRQLADATGIHRTVLSRLERGLRSGTWPQAVALAAALDVEVADIALAPGAERTARTIHGNAKVEVA